MAKKALWSCESVSRQKISKVTSRHVMTVIAIALRCAAADHRYKPNHHEEMRSDHNQQKCNKNLYILILTKAEKKKENDN